MFNVRDGYKCGHCYQYPENTELVYSNLTARGTRLEGVAGTVLFGLQYFIKKYLIDEYDTNFFNLDKAEAVDSFKKLMDAYLGPDSVGTKEAEDLHDLGHLPILIKAVPEGTEVPLRIPMLTIRNTDDRFGWLTNALETILSTTMWLPITSATSAKRFKTLLKQWADKTSDAADFVPFQGHDFSMRGMAGLEAAQMSGGAHLTSFVGTDTVPAISWLSKYYNADITQELVGCSVPATEHSVMCMYGDVNEFELFKDLITKKYPSGIISIVSDTWDFWKVVTDFLPRLKDEIMARDGKVVIRPDSGDPVTIIAGDPKAKEGSPQNKGLISCLYQIFGGSENSKGYLDLDPHIGAIYGDSITYDRANLISERLCAKKLASTNLVYGIGSYTYQYVTRDTHNMAVKATYGQVAGEARELYKDPKTDDGMKKSLKGLIYVYEEGGEIKVKDQCTWEEEALGLLQPVFQNGVILKETSLKEIREIIDTSIKSDARRSIKVLEVEQ